MKFEHCIRCTICVENCPVFSVEPKFPGPKQAGPDAQRFRMDGEVSVDSWVLFCSQCKRCETVCPYGVDVSEIILKAQIKYVEEHGRSIANYMFANTYNIGILASAFAPIVNKIINTHLVKNIMRVIGISTYIPFPRYHAFTLSKGRRKVGKASKKVVFFYGCYLNFNRPDIGRKIRSILVSMGLEVITPHQVCCGLPALGNGDLDSARRFANKNAGILVHYINRGYDVVYACTSCGLTLVRDYPGIIALPDGKKISENTYNVHEYILNLMEEGYVNPEFGPIDMRIAYHIPCHLRSLGIGYPAARLFEMVPDLQYQVLDDNCCGLSGTYGFKEKNKEVSVKLGKLATLPILEYAPDAIASDCGACRMQLGGLTGISTIDPSEIIFRSLNMSLSAYGGKKNMSAGGQDDKGDD